MKKLLRKIFLELSPILKFKIHEESMMPSFKPGDIVLVEKVTYFMTDPKIGDIVVLRIPPRRWKWDKLIIKRVVDFYDDWILVLGENQKKSIDSRHFGLIRKKYIIGRVFFHKNGNL